MSISEHTSFNLPATKIQSPIITDIVDWGFTGTSATNDIITETTDLSNAKLDDFAIDTISESVSFT